MFPEQRILKSCCVDTGMTEHNDAESDDLDTVGDLDDDSESLLEEGEYSDSDEPQGKA